MGTSPSIACISSMHIVCLAKCLMISEGGFKHPGVISIPITVLSRNSALPTQNLSNKGNCWSLSKSQMSLSEFYRDSLWSSSLRITLSPGRPSRPSRSAQQWDPPGQCSGGWTSVLLRKSAELPRVYWLYMVWGMAGVGDPWHSMVTGS